MNPSDLNRELGQMDLFLLDQVLKNRFENSNRILDAGCGEGRNSYYFIRQGINIYGVDSDPSAIRMAKMVARSNRPDLSENFIEAHLTSLPFPDSFFDTVICCSVLHFAENETEFQSMFMELSRVLAEQGLFFLRMIDDPEEGIPFSLNDQAREFIMSNGFELLEPYKRVEENGRFLNVMMLKKIRA